MTLTEFLRIARRSWWIVACWTVAVFASIAFFTVRQTPIYEATTTLVVWPDETSAEHHEVVNSLAALDRRSIIATYAKIPSSVAVQEAARQQVQLSPVEMQQFQTRASVVPDTDILRLVVEGPDPHLVTVLANAIAEQATRYAKEFSGIFQLRVLDPAAVPTHPERPDLIRNLSIGVVLGLVLGLGWVFLLEYLLHARHVSRQLEHVAGEPEEELSPLHR